MVNWPELVTGVLGGVGGSLIVVYGLSRWLGDVWRGRILEKVQQANRKDMETVQQENRKALETAQQDNRKELEALKLEMQASVDKANRLLDAGISKAVLVTRTQFETEFTAYKQIFAALSELSHCVHATRPQMVIASEEETPEQRLVALMERLRRLSETHNNTVTISTNLSPFYDEDIFRAVEKCFKISGLEIFEVQTGGRATFTGEWFNRGHRLQSEFAEGYAQVAKLIRDRLASLGVLPA